MDVQAVSCNLSLLDVYTKNISFNRSDDYDDNNAFKFNLKSKIDISDDMKKCKAAITLEITEDKNNSLNIKFIMVGLFGLLDFDKLNKKIGHSLLYKNTLAILFPYVRSAITNISSQSGIKPIILPPININALIDAQKNIVQDN